MTRTLLLGIAGLSLVISSGCSSGPMGPRGPFAPAPGNQISVPTNRPPIATQPGHMAGGTASSVKVVPYAAISRNALVPVKTGLLPGGTPVANGTRILNSNPAFPQFAANGRMIDGRPQPLFDRLASAPRSQTLRGAASGDVSAGARVPDYPPTPQADLRYRGGRTIRDLNYVNVYVGGQDAWSAEDWRQIDRALIAAMSDARLNNVIRQYFDNQPIGTSFGGSYFLSGWRPQFVAKKNLEDQIRSLNASNAFAGFDLPNTVVNFLLPRGTILGDPNGGAAAMLQTSAVSSDQAEDSRSGLSGYHGCVRLGNSTVYYATAVYSERLSGGGTNGIPVFDQNWKNVVATIYHQLQESRTDPDVDDAIRDGTANGTRFLGWTSDSGLEIGDHPLAEARQLKQIFVEVPLAAGGGTVPVQLLYSNAVHGPEGPISFPHGMEPPVTNPPTPNPSPVTNDPELAKLISQWSQLEDFVKKAIVRLANSQ